jgi:uncharacterized protein
MTPETIDETFKIEIDSIIKQLVDKFDINKVILFGSLARGDYNKNSDIDLCIIFNKKPRDTYEDCLTDIYLNTIRNIPADFVIADKFEYEAELKDEYSLFAHKIDRQGVIVYEQ